ncbi:hypothetical protein HK44_029190 (plasmid) [Pseudomonas fluorescens HK44]|jgi:hypothetical protein|uniref:Uncharacterized protein n=1 Tax=Pseudomonas fluorescens HK44 TaxID=1042209 RepID=A0A010RPE1_PSEFL|nr:MULTISPECIES: hypothetical protein [Pseudomonas]EXF90994.1 hypothetical protein HK44_029190 [Pseudomonas fluorescens HK44]
MMPIDPIDLLARLQSLYAAYPGFFQGAASVIVVVLAYFAVLELASRSDKTE